MVKETTWNGFRRIDFSFEGKQAILVFPKKVNENKNWLLKTEYFDAFPAFEIEMLQRGWHLAYVQNVTRWCLDEDLDRKKHFAQYLHEEYGLYPKCVPVGMSCGGLIAAKLAAKYPECVSALYLDAPVLNLLSCPGGVGVSKVEDGILQEFIDATGITLSALTYYREHPIDQLPILVKNNIPIILLYGELDMGVPYCENGAIFEKYYRENGGVFVAIGRKNCGHHPHGLTDNTPLIEFVEAYAT